jgi:Mor family transcriptional regulator
LRDALSYRALMRSDLDDRRIAQLYAKKKMSLRSVGAVLDCAPHTVARRLERQGIARRPATARQPRQVPPELVRHADRIVASHDEGQSLRSLARQFRTSEEKIKDLLRGRGVTLRGRGRPPAGPLTGKPGCADPDVQD